jgi:hypothetical protein
VEAQQSENSPTHKTQRHQLLLRFLVTVNDFAHTARPFFNGIHLATCNDEGYPYASECSHIDYFFRLSEAGYTAERALFRGIVGVVFQDEGERLPFFEIRYDKISQLFLQCAEDSAYRLGACLHFSLTYLCLFILRPTDFDVVATKLEFGLLTPFDTSTLPSIPVPKFPIERTHLRLA